MTDQEELDLQASEDYYVNCSLCTFDIDVIDDRAASGDMIGICECGQRSFSGCKSIAEVYEKYGEKY